MTTKKNTPKTTPAKVERAKRSTEATQSRPVEARPFAGLKESDLKSRSSRVEEIQLPFGKGPVKVHITTEEYHIKVPVSVVDSTVERQSADVVRVVKRAKGRKGAP